MLLQTRAFLERPPLTVAEGMQVTRAASIVVENGVE